MACLKTIWPQLNPEICITLMPKPDLSTLFDQKLNWDYPGNWEKTVLLKTEISYLFSVTLSCEAFMMSGSNMLIRISLSVEIMPCCLCTEAFLDSSRSMASSVCPVRWGVFVQKEERDESSSSGQLLHTLLLHLFSHSIKCVLRQSWCPLVSEVQTANSRRQWSHSQSKGEYYGGH